MKIFQKFLIGLCSLLPCFASVPQGSGGGTLKEDYSRIRLANIFGQADSSAIAPKFYPSSSVVTSYYSVQSNNNFDVGAVFAFSPSVDRVNYGARFSLADFSSSSYGIGFLVYSPVLSSSNYINQYTLSMRGVVTGSNKPALYTNTFVFYCFFDSDLGSVSDSNYIDCRFTLSEAYSSVDKTNGWFYLLPFVITKSCTEEALSAFSVGLWNGFVSGLSYSNVYLQSNYQDGFNAGQKQGKEEGYSSGYSAGKAVADKDVYKQGYDVGYSDGANTLTPVTTIWGLFGAIASVPTEIFKGRGDIAIWNTPILSILFSLLFLALVLWIVRKFI
jgi:hypothetical protein